MSEREIYIHGSNRDLGFIQMSPHDRYLRITTNDRPYDLWFQTTVFVNVGFAAELKWTEYDAPNEGNARRSYNNSFLLCFTLVNDVQSQWVK